MALLSQSGVKPPAICIKPNGHIHLVSDCSLCCKLPKIHHNNNGENYKGCIDIYLWNYNPDLQFLTQPKDIHDTSAEFTPILTYQENIQNYIVEIPKLDKSRILIPPLIHSTILII